MKYSINVTEAKNQEGNVKGFATLVSSYIEWNQGNQVKGNSLYS